MTVRSPFKWYILLGALVAVSVTRATDTDPKNRSKFKYGYVISHKGGSSQAHLESRDGNLALGRYYVNLHNGTSQKDAALTKTVSLSTISPPFGKRIIKTSATAKPGYPKLNYTPVAGGFYLTQEGLELSNDTVQHPAYVAGLTSQGFSVGNDYEGEYSNGVLQSKANTETFYPTSENVKNEIKQLHIQSTTPSIKTYTLVPQEGSTISGETTQFSQGGRTVKVSSYITDSGDLSYSSQKSIEKTNFADVDAQLISEVQKHAEQIILKDLEKTQNVNLAGFSPDGRQYGTATMQPIVVTSDGETGINAVVASTTPIPEGGKLNKDLQAGSINAVRIKEKNNDQILQDSGYFGVSLSPSAGSSINVSPPPSQLIDAESTDRDSDSNNSQPCESNLCVKDADERLSIDLANVSTRKEVDAAAKGTIKLPQTFYPQNKLTDERHYVTTIDVQKGISLDVKQTDDGTIQLAQNFPFNRIRPVSQNQNQYPLPTPQPLIANQVSVGPAVLFAQQTLSPPQQPYILNTVSTAPGLFDVTPNPNLGILQGFNDLTSPQIQYNSGVQDRIENNENQAVPPVAQVSEEDPRLKQEEDLRQIQQSIQDLRQQILSNIDAQHEEEQRKQNAVDEERKQYFENLRKIEELKGQNSYGLDVSPSPVQATAAPAVTPGDVNSIELVPQTQYAQAPPTTSYQTEIKDFANQIPLVQNNVQQTGNLHIYQKKVLPYSSQLQATSDGRPWNVYDTQNLENANVYSDNNIQPSIPVYSAQKVQLTNYAPQTSPLGLQPRYSANQLAQAQEKPQPVQPFVVQQPVIQQPQQHQQQVTLLDGQLNAVPTVTIAPPVVPQENRAPEAGKTFLVNNVVPLDYSKIFQFKQPIPLFQAYQVPLQTEPKITFPAIYSVPQQLSVPVQVSPAYKFITYPEVLPVSNKQYHATLTQRPNNKVRVQPLKPSAPDEESQREAVQNLLSQPQFHRTYYYPGVTFNNRLQLRHIRKNQISNSDQVRSQSLVRRGKSLKNLRIEYGFKPPLRPSVEFSEEVKPSIYGPSVQPQ